MRTHFQSCISSSRSQPLLKFKIFLRNPLTSFSWSRTPRTAVEELSVMWKKIGFSRTHGARARIIRRCAKPRRSLQSEGTRRRWTLQSHVQLSMEVQHHKHVCFVTCKRISTGFQAVGLSTRPVLLRKLAFLHRTLFSCLLSTNPPEIDANTTISQKNAITLVE